MSQNHPLAKFEIPRDEITRVVTVFYARVRVHPHLAPVFSRHIDDWPAHEATVADFWANAILGDRSYSGNVMATHTKAGDVKPGMFSSWLGLFDQVLAEELDAETARKWSALAHKIGGPLRAAVVDREKHPGGVPKLF